MSLLYPLLRPLLFNLDPEQAHELSLKALAAVSRSPTLTGLVRLLFDPRVSQQPVELFGLRFPNAVGLAAGYDKDARAWRGLAALGFGHVEVGTVTPEPQPGNPRPRVFRLTEDAAIINRLGFPGEGADQVAPRLEGPRQVILGVNLGKNKDTPEDRAADDYELLLRRFAPLADYLVVNVSSPNTPGLRELQGHDHLDRLLGRLRIARDEEAARLGRPVPLLVKLSPDLDDQGLDGALQAITDHGIDGVIATNTTIERPASLRGHQARQAGGLSGRPLTHRSTALVAAIAHRTQGRLPIIGVGGIMTPRDALERLDAGASLVQVYSGMIYGGPALPGRIVRAMGQRRLR